MRNTFYAFCERPGVDLFPSAPRSTASTIRASAVFLWRRAKCPHHSGIRNRLATGRVAGVKVLPRSDCPESRCMVLPGGRAMDHGKNGFDRNPRANDPSRCIG